MTTLDKIRKLIPDITAAEKAELVQWIVRDIGGFFPAIECRTGVMGGEPCVVRTRIPVWLLAQARILGSSEADILRAYPILRAQDLTNAWAYFRANKDEIELQTIENEMTLV